jgi:signal transduction histidine kinase
MPTEGKSHRLRSAQLLAFGGSLFIAITIMAACLAVWNLHHERIADAVKGTHNLAVVLAEQTARSFQAVDLVLQETREMVLAEGITDPDQFRQQMETAAVHQFLVDRLHSLPQANAISLIDDTGKIVSFSRSWPVPPIDTADRDFYTYWREHDDSGVFIGSPVINKVTGVWVLTVTRRISGPHGEFLGVVLGVIEAQYFEDFYRAITTDEGEAVSLFHRDGTLLTRYPRVEEKIGGKIPKNSPWYRSISSGGGTFRTIGYIGEAPRIVSIQPLREYPLAVTVGLSEDTALAAWRRQAMMIALAAIGAVIGFATLFRALAVQFRRLEQKSSELTDKTLELETSATELKSKTVELEENAAELKRSNAELEQFAYVASHDLQEPLRMVSSYCQLLQRRYGDKLDETAMEFIGFAVGGATRMQQLIKDLLAYSRVGRIGGSFEPLDMNEVVKGALTNLQGAIIDNGARIEYSALPWIIGEHVQLTQVFQNLIGNAIKFRREDSPVVRITARDAPGGMAQFTVEDNGIGINAEHLERAFVIFQRLHDREKYAGTGIGLAIAKKVVEFHGGRIWIDSTPGQGTRFHFTLPTADEAADTVQRDACAAEQRQYA